MDKNTKERNSVYKINVNSELAMEDLFAGFEELETKLSESMKSLLEEASKSQRSLEVDLKPWDLSNKSYMKQPVNTLKTLNSLNPHKYDTYDKYREDIKNNDELIKEKRAKIDEIESQLERMKISENIKWGFASLIYFSIVGVILPIILMPVTYELHLKIKWIAILLFVSGLGSVFYYINYELNYINKFDETGASKKYRW